MSTTSSRRSALAAVALIVIVAGLLIYAYQQGVFSRRDHLYVAAPDAAGIFEGMRVTTRGVVIGRVRSIALPPAQSSDEGARIELSIRLEHMAQIPKGTQARLVREHLIGKPAIDLVPPPGGAQPVDSGEVLALERVKLGDQIAQELQTALMPVIADARELTESLKDPQGPFQQTLKAGQDLASKMPAIVEKTDQVIEQTRETVKTVESGAVATLDKAGRAIGVVQEAAPAVMEKMQQAAATSQEASADVQAMVALAAERLPGVLDQVQAAATQTNQMVSNARQTWPISMLTGTSTTPQSLPIDSIGGLPLPGEAQ
ncbi:MlaD family protein [Variovorax sp. J22P240]|uniref:MlaD family protein n=1 Tax=Variovorax sp. J22P240 TaxID=3053514 RepID=UPI00257539B1|nr:MlaD family protein [Variovorax sp. J22P240]MDM0000632.1 MlaD family protein [Variovorax sp. J22P240]